MIQVIFYFKNLKTVKWKKNSDFCRKTQIPRRCQKNPDLVKKTQEWSHWSRTVVKMCWTMGRQLLQQTNRLAAYNQHRVIASTHSYRPFTCLLPAISDTVRDVLPVFSAINTTWTVQRVPSRNPSVSCSERWRRKLQELKKKNTKMHFPTTKLRRPSTALLTALNDSPWIWVGIWHQ